MVAEEYFVISETESAGILPKLETVPFEETESPRDYVSTALDNFTYSVDFLQFTSGSNTQETGYVHETAELSDGILVDIRINTEWITDQYSDVLFSMSDDSGRLLYGSRQPSDAQVLSKIILLGIDSDGQIRNSLAGGFDDLQFFRSKSYTREYITREELTEYVQNNAQHLITAIDEQLSIPVYTAGDVFTFNEHASLPEDYLYNAAFLLLQGEDGTVAFAGAMDALADYAWAKWQSDYYNYGYDEAKGEYYVSIEGYENVKTLMAVEFEASLKEEASYGATIDMLKSLHDLLCSNINLIIFGFAAAVILSVAAFVLMLRFAGWKAGSDTPQLRLVDKIPLELYMLAVGAAGAVIFAAAENLMWEIDNAILLMAAVMIGFFAAEALLAVCLCMSIARRIKTRTLLKNTVCAYIIKAVKALVRVLPDIWKQLLVILMVGAVYSILTLVCFADMSEEGIFFWGVLTLLVIAAVSAIYIQLSGIIRAAGEIASGDADRKVKTDRLIPGLREHAENINSIRDSASLAVQERMKSERMKTDLIANVSHDIKTPLTSVINYIDLLKRTDITDPMALEYIAVLEKQAVRLKRLVQDIVDASKASSGCIKAELAAVDLSELLYQATAEYADKFTASSITPVVSIGEDCKAVMADGRLLWRVFDNLLSNICKYSQPGTRTYIQAERSGSNVEISFRNISAEALNIPADVLMERFVRGDRSRHTEGSGLGLSIAESLAELQGGQLKLSIDGDLFRAAVVLPACRLPQNAEAAENKEPPRPSESPAASDDSEPADTPAEYQPKPEDEFLELPTLESGSEALQ